MLTSWAYCSYSSLSTVPAWSRYPVDIRFPKNMHYVAVPNSEFFSLEKERHTDLVNESDMRY